MRLRSLVLSFLLPAVAATARAQVAAASLDDVTRLVTSSAGSERILDRLKTTCISFIVNDESVRRLRGVGADSVLLKGLDQLCYVGSSLEVTSEPPGGEVWIGQRMVGKTPWTSPYPVSVRLPIEVRLGARAQAAVTDVRPNTLVRVHFSVPRDTLAWPVGKSVLDFGRSLDVVDAFQSKLAKPSLPPEPKGWGKFKYLAIGAVIGGGAAYAAASSPCAVVSPVRVVEGRTYGGESLGTSGSCAGGIGAGGAAVGGLALLAVGKMKHSSRVRGFNATKKELPNAIARWEEARLRERDAWLRAQPAIVAALDSQWRALAPEVDRVRDENARILASNATLPTQAVIETQSASLLFAAGPGTRGPAQAAVDVDTLIPRTRTRNANAIAVVIGNQRYQKTEVPTIEFARADAEVMRRYLIETMGFLEENIIYQPDATGAQLQSIFGSAQNPQGKLASYVRNPDSTDVFIYYSGHGAPDLANRSAYLVPTDADPNFISLSGYSVALLYDNLRKLRTRTTTVVLNACFSGIDDKGRSLITGAKPLNLEVDFPILTDSGAAVFTAGQADQISSLYDEKRHSLFTYFFLKGLQGAADTNTDRQVTYQELATFVAESVFPVARRLKNREQTPQFIARNPARPIAILDGDRQ